MAALTVTLRSSLEVGRGDALSSDSPKVDVLISDSFTTDNTEGEGEGERVSSTRGCLECLCRFLGGAGTRIRTGRFLGDANIFPTESEGTFDASPFEKCLLQTLGSAVVLFDIQGQTPLLSLIFICWKPMHTHTGIYSFCVLTNNARLSTYYFLQNKKYF